MVPIDGDGTVVLSVHQQCRGCDLGSGGALVCIPEERADKAAIEEALIYGQPTKTGGGHTRMAGQLARRRLRQITQEYGAHRQRVVACNPARLTL